MLTTIGYITSRIDPKFHYFIDSLAYQTSADEKAGEIELIFVDLLVDGTPLDSERHKHLEDVIAGRFKFHHVAPKSNVWQGSHRLTRENWFAAANARNTVLIRAQGSYVVFVDDLAVLTGQWWKSVKEAQMANVVTCGAYRKCKNLKVDNGNIVFFSNFPEGVDNRFVLGNDHGPVPCAGQWLYGCSFGAPLPHLLTVNGLDEACDGMGFEDCILGIRLANNGIGFQYDRRMLTYESEEDHHLDKAMRRTDKGVSPNDKSHAILKLAQGTKRAENAHFGPDGIEGLRKVFAETSEIPVPNGPTKDWYDGQPISEMI
jgi:hypothetical protein